jgi:hypothetical protein
MYGVQHHFPKWAKVLPEIKTFSMHSIHFIHIWKLLFPSNMNLIGKLGHLNIGDSWTIYLISLVYFKLFKISRFVGHVTGGYKLVNKQCINPKTGELLFDLKKMKRCSHMFTAFQ